MKDFDKAEKELQYILEKNPNSYGANLNLGLVYAEKGDEIKAESYLKKAIEIDDINWQGHFNLGILYAREKDFDKALTELKRAYELNPKSELIKENLLRVERLIGESKVGRKTK
jgi:Flp pilus assembly protein TadD